MEFEKLDKVLASNAKVFQGTQELMELRNNLLYFVRSETLTETQQNKLREMADTLTRVEGQIFKAKNDLLFSL